MKKLFFSLLAAIACGGAAMAAIDTVVIEAGGETTQIALSEKPTVKVSDDALVITTESATLTYETTQKVTFSFTEAGGIEDLTKAAEPTFYYDNASLRVFGLQAGAPVALYGINGMILAQTRADADGNAELDLDAYHGVIIVYTQNKTIKISKK